MRIEIKPTNDLTPTQHQDILDWLLETFKEESEEYEWSDVDWHILVWEDDQMVSRVEITERTGSVAGQPVRQSTIDLCGLPW